MNAACGAALFASKLAANYLALPPLTLSGSFLYTDICISIVWLTVITCNTCLTDTCIGLADLLPMKRLTLLLPIRRTSCIIVGRLYRHYELMIQSKRPRTGHRMTDVVWFDLKSRGRMQKMDSFWDAV